MKLDRKLTIKTEYKKCKFADLIEGIYRPVGSQYDDEEAKGRGTRIIVLETATRQPNKIIMVTYGDGLYALGSGWEDMEFIELKETLSLEFNQ